MYGIGDSSGSTTIGWFTFAAATSSTEHRSNTACSSWSGSPGGSPDGVASGSDGLVEAMNACHQVTQARNAASQAGLAVAPDGTGARVGGNSSENCSSPGDSSIGNDPSSTAAVGLPEA